MTAELPARGLTSEEAAARLRQHGPNVTVTRHTGPLHVLLRQLRSPLLGLLGATAAVSYVVGEHNDAIIIALILTASVGLGFTNEYRAERSAALLRARLARDCTAWRDGVAMRLPVTQLVPGDVVEVALGDIVPADLRLLEATGLECDESTLTGESLPVAKVANGEAEAALFMGTVVHGGSGVAEVTSTGSETRFGSIAAGLGTEEPPTAFQRGLRDFSMLLVKIAAVLTTAIFAINLVLHRPVIDAVLFSLAIAIGISPQLLPAVVSTSMVRGAHRLAARKVLAKRLVSIEDLGDIEALFTDKTGTLTEGTIAFTEAIGDEGVAPDEVLRLGAACTDVVPLAGGGMSGNAIDVALVGAATASRDVVIDRRPFDHDTRTAAVLTRSPEGAVSRIEKGAPEALFAQHGGADALRDRAHAQMAAGKRVIAVAVTPTTAISLQGIPAGGGRVVGILVFEDPPKASAGASLERLTALGVDVHIVTGDAAEVAQELCERFRMPAGATLTGEEVAALSDAELQARIGGTRIFARVSPEQKARIVRLHHESGNDVAFLGDGVNDAPAIHQADVGISVDTASDVAREAADVLLLEKDLGVLADGVLEGRRIFVNTTKYVLMGTSSNFGNMFSAAAASAFLSFLPMLPSQILLNNLLYDTSQLAIPGDTVDEEQLSRPAEWDIALIRRFMLMIGPFSSIFDFLTFALMLQVFHADAALFRSGWFVESLATQTLIVFVIRTTRVPFWRSRPSAGLAATVCAVVLAGAVLPTTALGRVFGFVPLSLPYFLTLMGMVLLYALIVDRAKRWAVQPMHR